MGFASPPASPAPHPAKMRVDAFTGRKEARGAHVKGEAMRTGEQLAGVSMQSSPDAPASSEGKMKDESKGARLEEADTSLRKNGTAARESVVDKKQAASKIAPELAKVMETLKASPRQLEDVTLAGKVKITKGRVKVSVKVSTLNDEVKKALEGAGLKIERVDESKLEVIGDISISDIEKLVLLKEVTTIEPAVSASN
jgi:hypothetical protein